MATLLRPGDRVTAVEHDDLKGGVRKPSGRRYTATVTRMDGAYVQVAYDDPAVNSGKPDCYWADSLWRAWDGALWWRLERLTGEDGTDGS